VVAGNPARVIKTIERGTLEAQKNEALAALERDQQRANESQ
jgi:hypothetical protein